MCRRRGDRPPHSFHPNSQHPRHKPHFLHQSKPGDLLNHLCSCQWSHRKYLRQKRVGEQQQLKSKFICKLTHKVELRRLFRSMSLPDRCLPSSHYYWKFPVSLVYYFLIILKCSPPSLQFWLAQKLICFHVRNVILLVTEKNSDILYTISLEVAYKKGTEGRRKG